jgi:hypothetical protein
MPQGPAGDLSSLMQLIFPNTHSIDEKVHYVVYDSVLVIALGDQLQHILIVLSGQVQPDDVETVVEECRQDARLGVPFPGRQQNMV